MEVTKTKVCIKNPIQNQEFLLPCKSVLLVTRRTMYNFQNSTDTLKYRTEKRAINKAFLFFIQFRRNMVKL